MVEFAQQHLALGQRLTQLGIHLVVLGHVMELSSKLLRPRAIGHDLEVPAEFARVVLEGLRLAAIDDLAVTIDPIRLYVGHDLPDRPADDVVGAETREALECRIDLQETIVHGSALGIADDLVDRKAVDHLTKEHPIVGLTLPKLRVGVGKLPRALGNPLRQVGP